MLARWEVEDVYGQIRDAAGGRPKFVLLNFTTNELKEQGGVNGAILHFLMEWGLTPSQEQEVRAKLANEKFVQRAPLDIVAREKAGLADLQEQLRTVQAALENLRAME